MMQELSVMCAFDKATIKAIARVDDFEKIVKETSARRLAGALLEVMEKEVIEFDHDIPADKQVVRPGEIQYRYRILVRRP